MEAALYSLSKNRPNRPFGDSKLYLRDGGALGANDGDLMVTERGTIPDLSIWRRGEVLQDQEKGAEDGGEEVRLLQGVPVKQ